MLDIRLRHLAIGIAVGAGIGAGGVYAYIKRTVPVPRPSEPDLIPTGPQGKDDASIFRMHRALKYGIPQSETLRFYEGFVASFDHRTRNPKWVLEYITKESLQGEGTREQSQFYEDQGLEQRFRSKLEDYHSSGYDRGHMAAAANHRASQNAMNDTFTLSNVSPQVGAGFNRDYWARFEKFVKDTAKVSDGVYIVTGPLWIPQPDARGNGKWEMRHPMIGKPPQLVSVPTHYFKVVLAENSSSRHGTHQAAVGAFVMPNAPIDPQTPVTAFAVPLEALESVSGAKFFPGFISDRRRIALDNAALDWQAEGKARLKLLDRVSIAQDQAALLPKQVTGQTLVAATSSSSSNDAPLVQTSGIVNRQPKTVNGEGAVHLCDVVACQMPPEKWWGIGGDSGSKGSSGGGSRSLQRQGSNRGRLRNSQEAAIVAEVPGNANGQEDAQ
eukprot:GHRR01014251.1.p1 GENE.GHRR01014251.1~~GHRR01014251.1.p1  ORF type:complete len:441 (+),score=151.04 GHRR01014251.1:1605-2927(+)